MRTNEIIESMNVILADDLNCPGKTDGSTIEISSDLNRNEQKVVLLHELGHILLLHVEKSKDRKYNPKIANIAGDAEIALVIYTDEEEDIINAPRSLLNGGITKKWVKENAPNCETFAELYDYLSENSPKETPNVSSLPTNIEKSEDSDDVATASILSDVDISEAIKNKMAELEQIYKKNIISKIAQKPKRKGIADYVTEIALEAIARRSSWRRQSRRTNDPFIKKGVTSERARPKVSVYVDRSGSFDQDKTREAETQLRTLSYRYGYKVDFDTFFFGGYLSNMDNIADKSTNYVAIAKHIIATRPRLAIVITDNDPCDELPKCDRKIVKVIVHPIGCSTSHFAERFNAEIC